MVSKETISGLTPEYEALIKLKDPDKQFPEENEELIDSLCKSEYIKKENDKYVFTKTGERKVIEVQQKVEATNYNLLSVATAAGIAALSLTVTIFEAVLSLLLLFFFAAFLAILQIIRSTIWGNI